MLKKNQEFSYFEIGKGQPIVILHGFLSSKEIWESFAKKLSPYFRVICFDLPGHGNSTEIADVFYLHDFAHIIQDFFTLHKIENPIIIGHSLGGYAALEILNSGINLRGFALFNSNPHADSEEKKLQRKKELRLLTNESIAQHLVHTLIQSTSAGLHEEQILKLHESSQKISIPTICNYIQAMLERKDLQQTLLHFSKPILIIQGDLDTKQPHFELPPHAHIVKIKNSGHYSFLDHENECIEAVLEVFIPITHTI